MHYIETIGSIALAFLLNRLTDMSNPSDHVTSDDFLFGSYGTHGKQDDSKFKEIMASLVLVQHLGHETRSFERISLTLIVEKVAPSSMAPQSVS